MGTVLAEMPRTESIPMPPTDAKAQLEQKALSIPEKARSIIVRDQATLDAAGAMLTEVIKPLRKQAAEVFEPIIAAGLKAHREALAGKAKVEAPLIEAEEILKSSTKVYLIDQERIRREEEDRLRREQEAREAEEFRLAEDRRLAEEAALNAQLQAEHEREIEEALESLPWNADTTQVAEICSTPAPEPIRIAPEIPVFAPVLSIPRTVAPKGLSMSCKFKAEVVSIRLLCQAVAAGKAPVEYVQANMPALNKVAGALKQSFSVPGVRAVPDHSISARGSR